MGTMSLVKVVEHYQLWPAVEGETTLHRSARLGKLLGLKDLYVKNEGENPTGSFKDRGMTLGVSKAVEVGAKKVACASTGNISASLAGRPSIRIGLRGRRLLPMRSGIS